MIVKWLVERLQIAFFDLFRRNDIIDSVEWDRMDNAEAKCTAVGLFQKLIFNCVPIWLIFLQMKFNTFYGWDFLFTFI